MSLVRKQKFDMFFSKCGSALEIFEIGAKETSSTSEQVAQKTKAKLPECIRCGVNSEK